MTVYATDPDTAVFRQPTHSNLSRFRDKSCRRARCRSGLASGHGARQNGHRYILGGEDISLKTLLDPVEAISGRSVPRIQIPGAIAQVTAVIMELIADHVTHRPPAATVEGVRIASRSKPLSIEKSRRELGYAPRPIEQALRDA